MEFRVISRTPLFWGISFRPEVQSADLAGSFLSIYNPFPFFIYPFSFLIYIFPLLYLGFFFIVLFFFPSLSSSRFIYIFFLCSSPSHLFLFSFFFQCETRSKYNWILFFRRCQSMVSTCRADAVQLPGRHFINCVDFIASAPSKLETNYKWNNSSAGCLQWRSSWRNECLKITKLGKNTYLPS